jgi:hypothetical protein
MALREDNRISCMPGRGGDGAGGSDWALVSPRPRSSWAASSAFPRRSSGDAATRAQAQAVAREAEHLIAQGTAPEDICAAEGTAWRGCPAAMEERGILFHLSGPAALFQRPEAHATPGYGCCGSQRSRGGASADSAAVELRSADLARLDDDRPATQARPRFAARPLESPQIPPEARERIQSFLKLYGAASAAIEERLRAALRGRWPAASAVWFAAQPEAGAARSLSACRACRCGRGVNPMA